MTESLFVYGTLMDPVVQNRVFGRVAPGKRDTLPDYRKDRIRLGYGLVYPIIRPEIGSAVEGLVFYVTPGELALIDAYEGIVYRRKKVTLMSGQQAWVYQE